MKKIYLIILLFNAFNSFSQVGIGTTSPDPTSILDITANDKGILVPRLTTEDRDNISNPATSLLLFNTTNKRFEYNSGTSESPIWSYLNPDPLISANPNNLLSTGTDQGAYLQSTVHMGKFLVTDFETITISGLPFKPSQIKFVAYANVEDYVIDADNGKNNNNNTYHNTFGSMNGYATQYDNNISQQVIFNGGSGNSINDISRYANDKQCIGIRYANQNGERLGVTAAALTSFNSDGFTLEVKEYIENIVVIYEAHR
ncbi:hypothetical protein ACFFU9_03430 [Mariniflexile ostreae]|uniref:Uncharacterized protein n=1 Tax=Mariniflexile ostreae TaxID=1520892 RepID=A0ABV5F8L7_9FLAO